MATVKKRTAKKTAPRATTRAKPRVGTRKVPRAERMEQMLLVGARVFAQHGYHATSMDEIAKRAGISKPMLYRYFESKDGLYLAIIDRTGQHMIDGLGLIMQQPDPIERIENVAIGLLSFIDRYRDLWMVMYKEALSLDGPAAQRVRYFRERVIANGCINISEALGNPTEEGRREAEPLSHAMVASGEAIAAWWVSHPDIPIARIVELVLDTSLPVLLYLRRKRQQTLASAPEPAAVL
ncbi:MAG TPA: TetR/AcrR family transcriptional regulator [Solimonas sp.]